LNGGPQWHALRSDVIASLRHAMAECRPCCGADDAGRDLAYV